MNRKFYLRNSHVKRLKIDVKPKSETFYKILYRMVKQIFCRYPFSISSVRNSKMMFSTQKIIFILIPFTYFIIINCFTNIYDIQRYLSQEQKCKMHNLKKNKICKIHYFCMNQKCLCVKRLLYFLLLNAITCLFVRF